MRLRELRKERNLRQKDVAQAIGVLPQSYGFYENGINKPDPDTLIRLAEFFEVSVDYLLGREDESSLAFTDKDRALGVVENAPIALSPKDRELIHLFDEAEEKLGEDFVQGVKQLVRILVAKKK